MKLFRFALLLSTSSFCAFAHPMGNFSINHYTRIELRKQHPELTYILDFAEIPTSELLREWGYDPSSGSGETLQRNAGRQAKAWTDGLIVNADSKPVPIKWDTVQASITDGAGGMPVLRVVMASTLSSVSQSTVSFQDGNYANRTGWKEVVVHHAAGVVVDSSTRSDRDLSNGLTMYPADLTVTPPQDLTASVTWHVEKVVAQTGQAKTARPAEVETRARPVMTSPAFQPKTTPQPLASDRASTSFSSQQPDVPGTVRRGDYLSRMLQQKHFGVSVIVLGLLAAFGLGAMHALSPGHGKTIVAAYLVGSRGTLRHAGILGLTVTFTHTISVFLLGIGVLFFQKYVIPERIVPILGATSGLSIVGIGAYLLYRRALALAANGARHKHSHHHSHAHDHSHSHEPHHMPVHHHGHSNGFTHTHTHGGHTHTHLVPEQITMGTLLSLGVSGGLVPCPSALILLLSAISLGQVVLGLALLGAFSLGLAIVLMAVGALVLYGKNLLPKTLGAADHPVLRLLPVFSSVVVIIVGLLMTLTATGVFQPFKLLS
jgi:ABC-type nickel/cobalt efflux system permease component RcnA